MKRPGILVRLNDLARLPSMPPEERRAFRRQQDERSLERLRGGMPLGALAMATLAAVVGPRAESVWLLTGVVLVIALALIPLSRAPWVVARPYLVVHPAGVAIAIVLALFAASSGGFESPAIAGLPLFWLFVGMLAPTTPKSNAVTAPLHIFASLLTIALVSPHPGSPTVFLVISVFGVALLQAGLRLRERSDAHAFLLRRKLDEANRALSGMNAELGRRVDEQVAEIRERAHDVQVLNAQLQDRVIDRSRELALALSRLARPARLQSPPVGAILNGRIELVRCIDSGGMGEVFEGVDRATGERVAVKTIHGQRLSDLTSLERFLTEARAAAAVRHEAIVRTFDIDVTADGTLFHVMELVVGETLARWLERNACRPVGLIARFGTAIAGALAAAHAAAVVHRDVKPSNIMLTSAPPGAKLLDFGIAKIREIDLQSDSRTRTNVVLGTPAYMAPEQAADSKTVTAAADVYSLGVVLYEALTGKLPDPQVHELAARRPEIPLQLARTVMCCLSRPPAARPRAAALASELAPFCELPLMVDCTSALVDAHGPTEVAGG